MEDLVHAAIASLLLLWFYVAMRHAMFNGSIRTMPICPWSSKSPEHTENLHTVLRFPLPLLANVYLWPSGRSTPLWSRTAPPPRQSWPSHADRGGSKRFTGRGGNGGSRFGRFGSIWHKVISGSPGERKTLKTQTHKHTNTTTFDVQHRDKKKLANFFPE